MYLGYVLTTIHIILQMRILTDQYLNRRLFIYKSKRKNALPVMLAHCCRDFRRKSSWIFREFRRENRP